MTRGALPALACLAPTRRAQGCIVNGGRPVTAIGCGPYLWCGEKYRARDMVNRQPASRYPRDPAVGQRAINRGGDNSAAPPIDFLENP